MGFFFKDKAALPKVSGKPTDTIRWRVAGVTYACRKNPKCKRLDVLRFMKIGAPVILESYQFKGRPAYMIVACKSGLDIGVLYESTAEFLSECYPTASFVGKLVENNNTTVTVVFDIYGERMSYSHISNAQAGVIYKSYKEGRLKISKRAISLMYDIAGKEEQPKELASIFGRVVERIFEEDYEGANSLLEEVFGE